MEHEQLQAVVESLIFVSAEPMTVGSLQLVLGDAGIEKAALRQAIAALQEKYEADATSGLQLMEIGGAYQFRTKEVAAEWIQRLNIPKPVKLSQAAMETLAIVAYRQPLVRAEVEEIRGVDCGGVLKTLLERSLVRIVGKRDEPGSPLLYGTTDEFLSVFNLNNLSSLPSLREYHELEHGVSEVVAAAQPESAEETVDPIEPISAEIQVAMESADQDAIDELESQVRSLRSLEGHIFPKPKADDLPLPADLPEVPVVPAAEAAAENDTPVESK